MTDYTDLSNYRIFRIPKANGKWRTIEEPNPELKRIQKDLLYRLNQFPFHHQVYGVKNRKTNDNVYKHSGRKVIIKMDVMEFFQNTTWLKYVYGYTYQTGLGADDEVIHKCFIQHPGEIPRLPTGAPTSPVIASIAFSGIDYQLNELAIRNRLEYTRYVDDLTFSGDHYPRGFQKMVGRIVREGRYELNHKKSQVLYNDNDQQKVLGTCLNNALPTITKQYYQQIRSELEFCAREEVQPDNSLWGKIDFIRSVDDEKASKLVAYHARRVQRWQTDTR